MEGARAYPEAGGQGGEGPDSPAGNRGGDEGAGAGAGREGPGPAAGMASAGWGPARPPPGPPGQEGGGLGALVGANALRLQRPRAYASRGYGLSDAEALEYAETTPFSCSEVQEMHLRFSALDFAGKGYLEYEECLGLDELRANPFAPRICEIFSEDGSGNMTFQNLLLMRSAFSGRTSVEIRSTWAFALWDFDGDDLIGPRDIRIALDLITNSAPNINEMALPVKGGDLSEMFSPFVLDEVVGQVLHEIDPETVGISFADFMEATSHWPDFAANVCHGR